MNLNFLHSHIYLTEKSPDDDFDIKNIWKEYSKRMCSCICQYKINNKLQINNCGNNSK
jgi:hypothetical protein